MFGSADEVQEAFESHDGFAIWVPKPMDREERNGRDGMTEKEINFTLC